MQMQVRRFYFFLRPFQRSLVEPHTVREMRLKEVIVSPRDFRNCFGQLLSLCIAEIYQRPSMFLADNHRLERPYSPPGTQYQKAGILKHHSLFLSLLETGIILKHVSPIMFPAISFQLF